MEATNPTNGAQPPQASEPPTSEVSEAARQAAQGDPALAVENRARRMGWVPKDEFRGDPTRWVPAERFVERGENELPILRERFRRADDTNQRLERELLEVKTKLNETLGVFSDFREFASKSEERAYTRAKAEVEAEMRQAAAQGDTAAFDNAKAKLDALEPPARSQSRREATPPASAPAQSPPPLDPATAAEIRSWVEREPWYRLDPDMHQTANSLYGAIEQSKPHLSTRDKLAEVKRSVMALFPDKFENPARSAPASVSSPTPGPQTSQAPKSKTKGYDDLPADAKRACDHYVATIPPDKKSGKKFTREDYVAMYFSGEQ